MSSEFDKEPVSEALQEFLRIAIEHVGGQSAFSRQYGLSITAVSNYAHKPKRMPRGAAAQAVAQALTDYYAEAFEPKPHWHGVKFGYRELLAYMWEMPQSEPTPLLGEHITTLAEDCKYTLDQILYLLKHKGVDRRGNGMCESFARLLRNALQNRGWDLSKDKDYKAFCDLLIAEVDEDAAMRLRAIALGEVSPTISDQGHIGFALREMGDRTPAYELALDCENC